MSRKRIIVLSLVFLVVAIAAVSLYFFTIYRIESSLQRLVYKQSDGKLIFAVKKVDLDIFDLRFRFRNPEIRTIDSSNSQSGYLIKAREFSLNVHSLISVISGKPLIIDSVNVQSPLFEVFKYKAKTGPHHKISLPAEMSKVYQSLEKILKVVNLNFLHISDASFRIHDHTMPGIKPLTVSNLQLTIDNVSKDGKGAEDKFLFADRILLEIYNEKIEFPDGYHGISFKKFWMGTRTRKIILDSCYIYGNSKDSASAQFSVFVDSLHIKNLDFNALANDNIIKFDSALCINPDIKLNLKLKNKSKKSFLKSNKVIDKDSIDQKLNKMLGNLNIGYLVVKNASVDIVSEKNNKKNVYKAGNSNFSISRLLVNNTSPEPFSVEEIKFDLHDYTGFSPDSLFMIQFDDVIIQQQKILLNNFRVLPTRWNHDPARKQVKMDIFELDEIDWMALLYEHRIIAGHASLIRPDVNIVSQKAGTKTTGKEKLNPFAILDKIKDKILIDKLFIEDGNVQFKVLQGPVITMNNSYIGINVNQLFASENEFRLIDALESMSFSKGQYQLGDTRYSLFDGRYSGIQKELFFRQITELKGKNNKPVVIDNARLAGLRINSVEDISIDELSWEKASVAILTDAERQKKQVKAKPETGYRFVVSKITGGPTQLSIKTGAIEASTVLNRISTGEVVMESGKKPVIKDLFIDGELINLNQQDNLQGSFDRFQVLDNKPSNLTNVSVKLPSNGGMVNVFIPKLAFSVDIHSSLNGNIKADFIELSKPVISFSKMESLLPGPDQKTANSKELPVLHINRITIENPQMDSLPASLQSTMQFNPGQSRIDLLGIRSGKEKLTVDTILFSSSEPAFKRGDMQLTPTGKSKIEFMASALAFQPATQARKSKWSVNINSLKFSDLNMRIIQNNIVKQNIAINSLRLENLHANDSLHGDMDAFLMANSHFRIADGNISLENEKVRLNLYNLTVNKAASSLSFDSIAFRPLPDRVSFMMSKEFQTTYNKVSTGRIIVKDIDFDRLLTDTVIYTKKVVVNDLRFSSFKDKRLPFKHGVEKPMLTDLLLNINPKIQVDSLLIKNGLIDYEEFNDKTEQYAKIRLSKLRGAIAGIKTFDPLPDDSLKFNVYARLIDTADLRVKYKQSYTDSLSGFNLKLIVNPLNLTALNSMLRTFASAELKSGNLDTIRMSVIGRKYVAFGVMKMYYDDLNAVYLKKGDTANKSAVTKTLSFFANRIVHTKNKHGTGSVYAERDPEKGFVNYWVKIVIGGVLTNAGVRTNKKQERKYEKGLKLHDVPPIPDIPVDY
jgi:hypothetical protein